MRLDAKSWHVVQSDTKRALIACETMHKQLGYEYYYPQMRVMRSPALREISSSRRHTMRGIMRPALTPLFPGYIFVLFSMDDGNWHDLFNLVGVYGMKVIGGLPAPVPTSLVENIKASEIGGAIPLEKPITALLFGLGDNVKVTEGPFAGMTGTIQDLDEARRRVLLDLVMFGSERRVPFSAEHVSRV